MAPDHSKLSSNEKKSPAASASPSKKKGGLAFKNAFQSPVKGDTKAASYSNKLIIEGLQNGIVVAWAHKANKGDEAAFLNHDFDHIKNDKEDALNAEINGVYDRKGIDGETCMSVSKKYPILSWYQLVSIVGSDFNKPDKRKELAVKFLKLLNSDRTKHLYQYPKSNTIFHADKTKNPPRAVDSALLDEDVITLMGGAYKDVDLTEVMEYEDIMETWWTDPKAGYQVMHKHFFPADEDGKK